MVGKRAVRILLECFLVTVRKRSLGQGNIFTPVCHSVHRGSTWAGTPLPCEQNDKQVHPPRSRYTPQTRYTPGPGILPPGRYTPWQIHPLGPGTPPRTRYPPWTRYTPWDQVHPPAGTPLAGTPPGRCTPSRYTPTGTPPADTTPSRYTPREQCMLGDTGNKRAVRILLECILVIFVLV